MMDWLSEPFPHAVGILFTAEELQAVLDEFPSDDADGWRKYGNDKEYKLEGPPILWGEATRAYFDKLAGMSDFLSELSGIPDLTMETIGGGYHLIPPGGYLGIHTDFNRSSNTNLFRRLNVLTYLNHGWDDEGGHLELWDDNAIAVTIPPEFGTTAIFETSDHSWHGHPKPANRWRKSVAAYFFSPEQPPGYRADHSTIWHDHAHSSY